MRYVPYIYRVFLLSIVLGMFVVPFVGSGQGEDPPGGGGEDPPAPTELTKLTNPLNNITSLSGFLMVALRVARNLGFLVAVFFIVYAGFLFVTAQGNDDKLKRAKGAFLWAIVGTAILLGAAIFVEVIQSTVNTL